MINGAALIVTMAVACPALWAVNKLIKKETGKFNSKYLCLKNISILSVIYEYLPILKHKANMKNKMNYC